MANNTEWNGRAILNGAAGGAASLSTVAFQVGMDPKQTISTAFGDFTLSTGSISALTAATLSTVTIASAVAQTSRAVVSLDLAMTAVQTEQALERSKIG